MSITSNVEYTGIKTISEIVGLVLKNMKEYARPGMSTKELDEYGGSILRGFGARSAPNLAYGFPGWTCISLNNEVAHGVPSNHRILKDGDLVNIDVSAELNGFWSDNGGSFILGNDLNNHQPLVSVSVDVLHRAIKAIKSGVKISDAGLLIETEAGRYGYKVIRNLVGHGVGRSLHESPKEIPCYYNEAISTVFTTNLVVAVEVFISTKASYAIQGNDNWTLIAKGGGFVAQQEHTIMVTEGDPLVLTESNGI